MCVQGADGELAATSSGAQRLPFTFVTDHLANLLSQALAFNVKKGMTLVAGGSRDAACRPCLLVSVILGRPLPLSVSRT